MGNCSKIVHVQEPFKNFGMSTKRIFDDAYLYLKDVNKKCIDKRNLDQMNGLPARSYYEVSSQYWNLIYKQPQKITIDQGVETQSSNSFEEEGRKTLHNTFNKAQNLNIAEIANEMPVEASNLKFEFGPSSNAPVRAAQSNIN